MLASPTGGLCLLDVSATPALGGHLLTGEQRARTRCSARLTLVQRTIAALLTSRKLGEFRLIRHGGIRHIAQRLGLGIGCGNHGKVSGDGASADQGAATQTELNNEFATVAHEIFPK